ncbi:MAG: winged helix-turn-helix domain-containing protein [Chloroflexota bacterium]
MDDFKPEETFLIEDIETLRVVADPTRIQIMEVLTIQAYTVKQVADKLGLAASKLYYHMNTLQKHGLVTLVGTKMVANLQEKYYRASANQFQVAEPLLKLVPDGVLDPITSIIVSTLDTTKEDVLRSLQASNFVLEGAEDRERQQAMVTRHMVHLRKDQANTFIERLQALLQEFGALDVENSKDPEANPWAFTIAFYPSIYFPEEE